MVGFCCTAGESATCVYISPPSWACLLLPRPRPSRSSEPGAGLQLPTSCLSVLHTLLAQPVSPSPRPRVHKSILCVCVSASDLQIGLQVRWMNLTSVIQSEVSQKQKQISSISAQLWNLERWYWWTVCGAELQVLMVTSCGDKQKRGAADYWQLSSVMTLWKVINSKRFWGKRNTSGLELVAFQFSSAPQSCLTFCDPMDHTMPGFPVHHQHLELAQTHVHQVDDAIQPTHPLLSPSPPAFNISQHQDFSSESVLRIKWLRYWGFSFSISPSNEYSGLISLRIDWFDLLAVQGTQESSPTPYFKSISSAFSFLYSPTLRSIHGYWENHSFTRWTFIGKIMSVLSFVGFRVLKAIHIEISRRQL